MNCCRAAAVSVGVRGLFGDEMSELSQFITAHPIFSAVALILVWAILMELAESIGKIGRK